jgi:hypothetical protein
VFGGTHVARIPGKLGAQGHAAYESANLGHLVEDVIAQCW